MTTSFNNITGSAGGSTSGSTADTRWRNRAIVAGIGLAASYLFVRSKTAEAARENPPRGKFVEVDGVRLHYLERGTGPALVLLHGNGVYSTDFEYSGLVDKLSERYRVIAFDRPGFGYSERPRTTLWTPDAQARLLHQAMQQIGIDSAIVLGHSWGTMVALAMGLQVPDAVRGLVLLSGYYYPTLRLDVPLAAQPAIPGIGDLMRHTITPLFGRLMWPLTSKHMFYPMPVAERFRRLSPWMALRPKQVRASAADAALMIPAAMSLSKRIDELRVPVQIIAGSQDKVVKPSNASEPLHAQLQERLQGQDTSSELHLMPGVGHMVHYAHPAQVVAAVDAIAAQVGEPVGLRSPRAEALARASESGV